MTGKVIAIALIASLSGILLRECGFRAGGIFSAVASISVLMLAVGYIGEILDLAAELSDTAGIAEAAEVAIKLIGIGYLFGFAQDTCESLGEGALAKALSLCARIESTVLVLPYFKKILSVAVSLLE